MNNHLNVGDFKLIWALLCGEHIHITNATESQPPPEVGSVIPISQKSSMEAHRGGELGRITYVEGDRIEI